MALAFVFKDTKVRENIHRSMCVTLDENIRKADRELDKLLQDVACNHYYTNNIQRERQDRPKKHIQDSMKNAIQEERNGRFHFSNSQDEVDRLVNALQVRMNVDMAEQACSDAQTDLDAYYKVSSSRQIPKSCMPELSSTIFFDLLVNSFERPDPQNEKVGSLGLCRLQ